MNPTRVELASHRQLGDSQVVCARVNSGVRSLSCSENMEILNELERQLMPSLHIICQRLRSGTPNLKTRIFSNGGGDLTPNPWHILGVNCRLHEDWDNPPNEVMIQVVSYSTTSQPMLDAYVMWDYTFDVEVGLFARPVPASDEAIQMIERFLPQLEAVLMEAVRRGYPIKKS